MFQFFVPATKVQKDRQFMRDTDARVAKYSRRGLILNFIVFVLCLAFGDFFEREFTLSVILVVGLLLVTLLRNYYLFRFDTLYARAPARWRNQYFVASCLGAAWWSIILVSLTWTQGMHDETLVMWLYTVVFYSSVANVFAPYHRFLSIYLFIGMIPASITAFFLGEVHGYLYGFIMLIFYLMLIHQAKVTAASYWERLEATWFLQEHARGLEHDQKNSREAIELKDEFLVNLGQEFRSSLSDILGTLTLVDDAQLTERQRELLSMASKAAERQLDLVNNVVDFSRITTQSLTLEYVDFDLRRVLEKLVQDFALDAHQQGVELYYHFDPDLPSRVRGDLSRLGQILNTLVSHALKNATIDHVFIEAGFNTLLDRDDIGQLQIVISDSERKNTTIDDEFDEIDTQAENKNPGIGLSICKGLAACMDGSVNVLDDKQRGNRIFLNIKLQVLLHEEKRFGAEQKLRGKRGLLVDFPESVALALSEEISSWGMTTYTHSGYDLVLEKIEDLTREAPLDVILLYTHLNSLNGLGLSRDIIQVPQFAGIKQIIALSMLQSDTAVARAHLQNWPQVSFIEKPIMRRRLYDALLSRVLNLDVEDGEHVQVARELNALASQPKILLIESHRVDQMVISAMLKKMGYFVQLASSATEAVEILEKEKFNLVLMDFDAQLHASVAAVQKIRTAERANHVTRPLPIVAISGGNLDDSYVHYLDGMDDQLTKPIRYDELSACVTRWLQSSGSSL
ncbi:ATP-binding response regulator [Cellvibrio polysaccharolyticus]|uniref:histidine kinase n=1 Tax=Cellvibrio polysaccharolyticus TaxID=2082724 RepID=A0A928V3R4_9GAMM|nr:response regulator [Cellvibrio polysaccharolyticus]MBE8717288.1 response regulator [Cellvibrio polysaccharolyticus]